MVATLRYWNFGIPLLDCSRALEIVPDPTALPAPVLGVVDCGFFLKTATGGRFAFGLPNCPCNESNATEASTFYDKKTALVAADLLNDRVLPFYESEEVPVLRILTDRGTEYCGNAERHEYE